MHSQFNPLLVISQPPNLPHFHLLFYDVQITQYSVPLHGGGYKVQMTVVVEGNLSIICARDDIQVACMWSSI